MKPFLRLPHTDCFMDSTTLVSSFALLFLAEMGDKTQLMAMTLAHRYRLAPVIVGTFFAFLLLNLLAVLLGDAVSRLVPRHIVLLAAGGLFLLFAYRSWRDGADDDGDLSNDARRQVWVTSFLLIFMAELGDKTQLAMVALAAQSTWPWSVFLGGTLALWSVSLLGMLLGRTLLRQMPTVWVHRSAALLFLAFGLLAIAEAVGGLLAAD